MTIIYTLSTDALEDRELFREKALLVSKERNETIGRLRFDRDKRLSLGAGLLLRQALSEAGLEYSALTFCKGEYGKPYIKNHPELHYNLSHSENRVICALSDKETGCDIEKIAGGHPGVAERFFASEECRYINEIPGEENIRFYRLWTMKESFIKNLGKGLAAPLNSFCVPLENNNTIEFNGEKYTFFTPEIDGSYCCAVCIRGISAETPGIITVNLTSENEQTEDNYG